jgi:hypothetical protein
MKNRSLRPYPLLAGLLAVFSLLTPAGATAQDSQAKVSDAESKAAKAVEATADLNARIVAAGAFVKKYPNDRLKSPFSTK